MFYTVILYRASTGPEQGFPCLVFPHREKPVLALYWPCKGLQCTFNPQRFFVTPVRIFYVNMLYPVAIYCCCYVKRECKVDLSQKFEFWIICLKNDCYRYLYKRLT